MALSSLNLEKFRHIAQPDNVLNIQGKAAEPRVILDEGTNLSILPCANETENWLGNLSSRRCT